MPEPTSGGLEILHLDMDAFFASVEVLADPSLRGKPVVVGGTGARSVVASASYEARVFGVRSAMPMSEARRRCPALVVVSGRHDSYAVVSRQLLEILGSVTPVIEPIALDEAFLDVSGAHGLFGSSEQIAVHLRNRVREELSLGCAVGVGRTKLVAKLASKAAKPQASRRGPKEGKGVVVVSAEEEQGFLHAHEIRALPGIGPRTAERLLGLGVTMVADLAAMDRAHLTRLFGKAHGEWLSALAQGRDDRRVVAERTARSIGREQTFPTDDFDHQSLERRIREICESLTQRCRDAGLAGRTVSLKVRFGDFTTIARSRTLGWSVHRRDEIAEVACDLLRVIDLQRGVRLIGVSISGLEPVDLGSGRQLELFGSLAAGDQHASPVDPERREEAEQVADEIRRRYGDRAISSLATAPLTSAPGKRTN